MSQLVHDNAQYTAEVNNNLDEDLWQWNSQHERTLLDRQLLDSSCQSDTCRGTGLPWSTGHWEDDVS